MHEVKLSDGIVTLSPLRLDDAEAHLAGEDELVVRWLNGGPGTWEGIRAYFRHCREQWDTSEPLRAFGIRMGADEVLAGTIDLRFSGEGLAPGQVNVAYGQVEPENPASAAVARRAGFTPSKPTHGKDGTRFDWYIRDLHTAAR
jgi:RimJ/RimL family protein N-acetyltransferase